jgi:hypothetical protein
MSHDGNDALLEVLYEKYLDEGMNEEDAMAAAYAEFEERG